MYTPDDDDVLIQNAAASGDLQLLQELEAKIGDANDFHRRCEICKDYWGRTGLHFAASKGFLQICKFLIEKVNVDMNLKTDFGDTPLLLAIAMRNINSAKYLINRGADITISNFKGMTSLHYAAAQDNKELMEMLLSKGADMESNSVNGTPLQCAAARGNVESIRFLLGHGAKPNVVSSFAPSPLASAILSHSFECLELLLKAGADPNIIASGLSPLGCAVGLGEAGCLRSLLAAGANPNIVTTFSDNGNNNLKPVEQAVGSGNLDAVKILFPLTERIPSYPDWSIDGIINYYHTEEAKTKIKERRIAYFQFVDQEGKNAVKRKDYAAAVKWFSEAIYLEPDDARLRSNRSICWAKLNEPVFALADAESCVDLRPDWAKAHYREGVARMLLKSYLMASRAFNMAKMLEPGNEEIDKAFEEAVVAATRDVYSQTDRWRP